MTRREVLATLIESPFYWDLPYPERLTLVYRLMKGEREK
jgi:hypothetical protein